MNLNYVPKSYEDLYRHYFTVKGGKSIVGTLLHGIMRFATEDEMESLMQDVFERMMRGNLLEKFDPAKGNFGGILFVAVRSVAANYLGRKSRDPLGALNAGSLVESTDDEEFEVGTYSLDRRESGEDLERATIARDAVARLKVEVAKLVKKADNLRERSLLKVVDLLAEESTPDEIAVALGVSRGTAHNWIARVAEIARGLNLS